MESAESSTYISSCSCPLSRLYSTWLNLLASSGSKKGTIDDPPPSSIGGYSKIDSVQNVIMIPSDFHDSWDNYEFGVNPNDNYRITALMNGLHDINGLVLQLAHIEDPKIRPIDNLFRDHFLQGVLKYMKGRREPSWDHEYALGDGGFDLSRQDVWRNIEGKERL